MNEIQAVQLFKCLADTTRLQLLSALSDGPKYVELLSQLLERSPSTVSFHLKKLEETGLVEAKKEQYYTMYSLNRTLLEKPVSQLVLGDRQQLDAQAVKEQQYRENVLKNLFEYGKLKTIPVQRKKRRIVLEKLAEHFEAGVRYPEKQVNLILADFHDDFCTLRREMIAEGIMARDKGEYWLRETETKEEL
ncbi:MAG: metalloregulator ArsR/SmtB family transcription factor [Clostridia bacterium]|nr:metalloregulator ArsR/SmtB family transcription factor [Clostridia bacterium]